MLIKNKINLKWLRKRKYNAIIKIKICRYNLGVKCMLPKHNSRVRFPLPAPNILYKKSFFRKAFFIAKTTIYSVFWVFNHCIQIWQFLRFEIWQFQVFFQNTKVLIFLIFCPKFWFFIKKLAVAKSKLQKSKQNTEKIKINQTKSKIIKKSKFQAKIDAEFKELYYNSCRRKNG